MSWKDKTVEQSRMEFVLEVISGERSMSELCRKYGISRPTGYKWLERYMRGENMDDRSHSPLTAAHRTKPEVEELILETRARHPTWGGHKIVVFLRGKGHEYLPAASTANAIIKRHGLISPEESEKHTPYKRFERERPNQLWQMDFKGHFAMLNGERCHPLTITDDCSRKLICLDAYNNEQWKSVENSLLRVFSEYGLPDAILSDNGRPWGDPHMGYTQYEVWMMQLGVTPMHGRPLHPQTQGKDERFHRTLKEDVLMRTAITDISHAQRVFDDYRVEFNSERPHAALGYDVPDKHYRPSRRQLPEKWSEPEYADGCTLRKVNYKGYISINRRRYYLSESLIGKYIELEYLPDNRVNLYYGNYLIGIIDLDGNVFVSKKIYPRNV